MGAATTRTEFGARLEAAYKAAGYDTQTEFAAAVGVEQPTVSEWLTDPERRPDRWRWPFIEQLLELDEDTIYQWDKATRNGSEDSGAWLTRPLLAAA